MSSFLTLALNPFLNTNFLSFVAPPEFLQGIGRNNFLIDLIQTQGKLLFPNKDKVNINF
jgi:hypothetical protein